MDERTKPSHFPGPAERATATSVQKASAMIPRYIDNSGYSRKLPAYTGGLGSPCGSRVLALCITTYFPNLDEA
jgi:hypothetical protein